MNRCFQWLKFDASAVPTTHMLLKEIKDLGSSLIPGCCQESSLFLGYFHLLWQLPPTQPWEPSRNTLEHSMMSSFLLEHSMMSSFLLEHSMMSSFCLECSMTSFCIPECSMMSSFLPECSMTSSFFQDVP